MTSRHFNYKAETKSQVGQTFTANTLRYGVTLTFDPLILNIFHVGFKVIKLKIKQSVAELLIHDHFINATGSQKYIVLVFSTSLQLLIPLITTYRSLVCHFGSAFRAPL